MSDFPILGPQNAPSMAYEPRVTTELCEATKDLLLFLRVQGIRINRLEVTDKGICLDGITDDYPSKRQTSASPPGGPVRQPSYDDPADPNDL